MPAIREILVSHNVRYPDWKIADLFKLLHQGAMGSEHAVTDIEQARSWLEDELAHLTPARGEEPLIDPISEDGEIVRVNLRPFAALSIDPEELLQAFVGTAAGFAGSRSNLERAWEIAQDLCFERFLPFDGAEMADYFASMRGMGFPAVHHSEIYEVLYHPAYRVVARACLPLGVWG